MSKLTVWKFSTADGAAQAEDKLRELSKLDLITVDDACIITWADGAKKPKTHQLHNLTGQGALSGAMIGMIFGLLFFFWFPFFGILAGGALGAGFGALGGALSDYGIDDDFIDQLRQKVVPGTSALFLLSENETADKVEAAFADFDEPVELLFTNLSTENEKALADAFHADHKAS